ncbi:MAG TPA: folylpolyglutamate synthase/dihydrofolate synthase family protein [Vicinamibacterales bacterium]|nr:folylpolyglutamate synthase/dihydrofolate synthase family protein [Vicinamibacterales bacterium]
MNALDYVFGLEQFGIKLGLDNIRALCGALRHPELAFQTVVVAGTNGKGSVTAMVDAALRAAGQRSARYTSPHLFRLEERFVIDGREIDPADLATAAEAVVGAVDRLLARGELHAPPTFFEATTAIAFHAFREAGTRIAVLEVGLGGRLDATNVAAPLAVAITSIDRDHEQQLGHSLEEIAYEKAGVIKAGTPVVIGPLADGPRAVIARVATERDAPLVVALDGVRTGVNRAGNAFVLDVETPRRRYPPVALALPGAHQAVNAVVAVRLLEALEYAGIPLGADAIARGLSDVRWPGRLEWIETSAGRLLLDAAHNPAGARALAAYLAETHPEKLPLVFGVVKDKDVRGMVEALAPVVGSIVATQAATQRALPADEVAAAAREVAAALDIEVEPDPLRAVRAALARSGRAVVAGSIFLIGEVRGRLAK